MKTIGGILLLFLGLFMGWGFIRSDFAAGPALWLALLVAVALPAAAGIALLADPIRRRLGYDRRKARLERETLDAEVLRLAAQHEGRLTILEVVSELGIAEERVTEILNGFHSRDRAEIEVTPSGVLVYRFHDVQHLHEKPTSRGILDA